MTFWIPDTIRAACAGTWLIRPPFIDLPPDRPADLPLPPLHAPITGVSTDSRTIKPGQVFIALRGDNHDGHAYLAAAAASGASILIVDSATSFPEKGFAPQVGVMKVSDTGKALLKIAAAYRKSLDRTKVIAVCGSNGKTTTTRLIEHLLSQTLRGTASKKSFNNAVGVPLTILSARENDQYLICEVGTNAPGEIVQLAEVVRPDIAVITSIGREHLEKLLDLAGVAREEAGVIQFIQPKGCLIATADAPELVEHLRRAGNVVTFGRSEKANLRLTSVAHTVGPDARPGLRFTINSRQEATLPLAGEHNALNAIAALAVARRMGLGETRSIAALAAAGGAEMRMELRDAAGLRVINDAYNANPDSMIAGIRTAVELRSALPGPCDRLVLVLGEMLELGAASDESHRIVARAIVEASGPGRRVDHVVLVGAGMRHAVSELAALGWPADGLSYHDDAEPPRARLIADGLVRGDLVLLKGSRRVGLERVLKALEARVETAAATTRGASSGPVLAGAGSQA